MCFYLGEKAGGRYAWIPEGFFAVFLWGVEVLLYFFSMEYFFLVCEENNGPLCYLVTLPSSTIAAHMYLQARCPHAH